MVNTIALPSVGSLKTKKKWDPPKWMYPLIYNKWKILIGVIITVLVFSFFSIGFAAEDGPALISGMAEDIFNADDLTGWYEIEANGGALNLEVFTGSGPNFSAAWNAMATIGVGMLMIFWCIGFFDMITQSNNQFITEQLVRRLLVLIIGVIIVTNSWTIVTGMMSIATAIGNMILGSLGIGCSNLDASLLGDFLASVQTELGEKISFTYFLVWLGYVMQLFVPWIASLVISAGVKMAGVTRYIEVCIMAIMSPLLFCDISAAHASFAQSQAFRGLKSMFALALQGAIVLVSLGVIDSITGIILHNNGDFMPYTLTMIALMGAKLGVAAKSHQISRQLVGLG